MPVAKQSETHAGLGAESGEVAKAGIHFPETEDALLKGSHPSSKHDDEGQDDHEHGFELVEVLRVVFVALAAAAVWFHLWEPFPASASSAWRPR